MHQFDVAGGKLGCHGPHVIFCLSVFVFVKHSGTCNFTSLPFWVCFASGSAIFKEHSVALMPKMQLYSFKRTNLESALVGVTLITAKSLHAHAFPHSHANNFHYIWGHCRLLHPCGRQAGEVHWAQQTLLLQLIVLHYILTIGRIMICQFLFFTRECALGGGWFW
jgi:hypothetical protein